MGIMGCVQTPQIALLKFARCLDSESNQFLLKIHIIRVICVALR